MTTVFGDRLPFHLRDIGAGFRDMRRNGTAAAARNCG